MSFKCRRFAIGTTFSGLCLGNYREMPVKSILFLDPSIIPQYSGHVLYVFKINVKKCIFFSDRRPGIK